MGRAQIARLLGLYKNRTFGTGGRSGPFRIVKCHRTSRCQVHDSRRLRIYFAPRNARRRRAYAEKSPVSGLFVDHYADIRPHCRNQSNFELCRQRDWHDQDAHIPSFRALEKSRRIRCGQTALIFPEILIALAFLFMFNCYAIPIFRLLATNCNRF